MIYHPNPSRNPSGWHDFCVGHRSSDWLLVSIFWSQHPPNFATTNIYPKVPSSKALMLRESWVICKRFLDPKGFPRIRHSVFHHANSLDFWMHRQGGPAQSWDQMKVCKNKLSDSAFKWDMLVPWRVLLVGFHVVVLLILYLHVSCGPKEFYQDKVAVQLPYSRASPR